MKLTFLSPTVATILAFAFLGQVTNAGEVTDTAQVIVLKLDDVVAYQSPDGTPIPPRWQRVTDFLTESDTKASYGIIGFSLEEDNQPYFAWIKKLHKSGLIEFWNHGYRYRKATDKNGEFEGSFEEQKTALERTQKLAKEKLGIELNVFGPHWSGTNEDTSQALKGIPEIKIWFYGPTDSGKLIFPRFLTLENPTHVPDFAKFKEAYDRVGDDKKCLALQGHPNSWDDERWANFVKIIDFLKSKGCVFMTPSEYMAKATAEGNGEQTGWTSIFNGKNLDGWVIKCLPQDNDKRRYWKVVGGTITAETPPNGKHNYIWLLTEKEYDDFELRMKVQTYGSSTGNSGIQVRSRYDDESGWLNGPQVDINPPGPWRCGFIYDETREAKVWLWPDVGRPANAKPEHAPEGWKWSHAEDQDAWNDVHIVCKGTRIKTIINGITIADCDGAGRLDDEAHRSHNVGLKGHIGLQIHPGKELLIRFKDIEVKPIMKNSIFVIKPYKWNGMWVFDDERVGLDKEPFVAGADTMIDTAIQLKGIQNADQGFLMVFSAGPFPDADFDLEWVREDSGGNVYKGRFEVDGDVKKLEGWLCPALPCSIQAGRCSSSVLSLPESV